MCALSYIYIYIYNSVRLSYYCVNENQKKPNLAFLSLSSVFGDVIVVFRWKE